MTPSQAAHFAVYSPISLYASRVVYLIGERIWVALRRWYELKQIWTVFESDMDSGFLAEHNAKQRLEGGPFDRLRLIDAVFAEMRGTRKPNEADTARINAGLDQFFDPDYRAFQCDAEEYESTESSKSAA